MGQCNHRATWVVLSLILTRVTPIELLAAYNLQKRTSQYLTENSKPHKYNPTPVSGPARLCYREREDNSARSFPIRMSYPNEDDTWLFYLAALPDLWSTWREVDYLLVSAAVLSRL